MIMDTSLVNHLELRNRLYDGVTPLDLSFLDYDTANLICTAYYKGLEEYKDKYQRLCETLGDLIRDEHT